VRAELGIQSGKPGFRADALAVGRIGDDEARGAVAGRVPSLERAFLDVQPLGDAGVHALASDMRTASASMSEPKMQRRGARAARRARASAQDAPTAPGRDRASRLKPK
jgi:hypothetical protein